METFTTILYVIVGGIGYTAGVAIIMGLVARYIKSIIGQLIATFFIQIIGTMSVLMNGTLSNTPIIDSLLLSIAGTFIMAIVMYTELRKEIKKIKYSER